MSLPKKRKPLAERIEEAIADLTREADRINRRMANKTKPQLLQILKETQMSTTNKKKSNKTELNKLGKTQKREKIVAQKTGKKDKTGKPRKKVETGLRPVSTTTKDATVTIKPRAVKIKPAA